MHNRHKFTLFILEIMGAIVISTALSPIISGPYSRLVAMLADLVTPSSITVNAGEDIFNIYSKGYLAPVSLYSLPFLGGSMLTLALIVLTPGIPARKRPQYLVEGLACSVATHVAGLAVLGMLIYFRVSQEVGYPVSALFFSIGIYLFPALIWFTISHRYWWPVFVKSG